jgi:hypothetical protein
MSRLFARIQWSVVYSILRSLSMVGGTGYTLLVALGDSPAHATSVVGIGSALLGVLAVLWPMIGGAFTHTDSAKVASVALMPAADQLAALNKISDAAKVLVAAAVTGTDIAVNPAIASPAVIAVAKDDANKTVNLTKGEAHA